MSGQRRTRHLSVADGGRKPEQQIVSDAGQRARNLVHLRGGYVPQKLDRMAGGSRGLTLAHHIAALVLPLHDAGYTRSEIHEFGAQTMHRMIEGILFLKQVS